MTDSQDTTTITVRTFAMRTDKEAALKPLKEASEVRAAWQDWEACAPYAPPDPCREAGYPQQYECDRKGECDTLCIRTPVNCGSRILADEIADCIQACCNLAARYHIDLQAAMDRCYERNRARGRIQDGEE
jgi:hypothetical protein